METFFRKVSAKERLPKKDGTYICFISCCEEPKEGCSTGWGDCNFQDNNFLCPEEKILFWLEEIHYYTEEELKQFELTRAKIAKATDNFVKSELAVTPNEV